MIQTCRQEPAILPEVVEVSRVTEAGLANATHAEAEFLVQAHLRLGLRESHWVPIEVVVFRVAFCGHEVIVECSEEFEVRDEGVSRKAFVPKAEQSLLDVLTILPAPAANK